ncbi:hypothetical protein [Marinoscillum sp. MHG1-6]|uniref:hypothetical protein n=1 Tax=Marinoscillum sp. MHG1-6 TaxID=2959627 RepID=UPI00215738F1|nr:hypothetical protein [Marinoscillum sp. MHG1-6]
MKRSVLFIWCALLGYEVMSQDFEKSWGKYEVDTLLLDFVVPDVPAFKALGTDPSNILRPSDVQKFAIAFDPFFDGSNAVIPDNFAVDFAPWKLLSGGWTLESYRENWIKRVAYNSSFSIGTLKDNESGEFKAALGYRVKIAGKNADLLTSEYINEVYVKQATETELAKWAYDQWRKMKDLSMIEVSNLDSAALAEREQYFEDNLNLFAYLKDKKLTLKDYNKSDSLKAEFKKSNYEFVNVSKMISDFNNSGWNATRTDLAVAMVGVSADSLVKNIQYANLNLWVTQSLRLGKKGQLLIGGNLNVPDAGNAEFTLSARAYVGNNKFRAYSEYQFINQNDVNEPSALINLGAEFNFISNFWFQFYAGVEDVLGESGVSQFRSSLNLKYSFNETAK